MKKKKLKKGEGVVEGKKCELKITVCAKKPMPFETREALRVMAEKAKAAFEKLGPDARRAMCVPPYLAKRALNFEREMLRQSQHDNINPPQSPLVRGEDFLPLSQRGSG